MKLWILMPLDDLPEKHGANPWHPWYDKKFGCLVRAENEADARRFASESCSDEGEEAWLDENYSICYQLTEDGEVGEILADCRYA